MGMFDMPKLIPKPNPTARPDVKSSIAQSLSELKSEYRIGKIDSPSVQNNASPQTCACPTSKSSASSNMPHPGSSGPTKATSNEDASIDSCEDPKTNKAEKDRRKSALATAKKES